MKQSFLSSECHWWRHLVNELTVPEPHSNYFQSIGTKSSVHNVRDELTQISVMIVSIAIFCYQMTSSSHRFNDFYLFLHGSDGLVQNAKGVYPLGHCRFCVTFVCGRRPFLMLSITSSICFFGLLVRNIAEDLQIYISSFAASLYF